MKRNPWVRNLHFKWLVLCAFMLLGQGLFIRSAHAATQEWGHDRDDRYSVITRGPGQLDIFVVNGVTNEIWMRSFNGGWTDWRNLGRAANGHRFYTVSAVASGNNRWDIFATVGSQGDMVWHKSFDGAVESGWVTRGRIGFGHAAGIQAVSNGNGQIDLFNRNTRSSSGTGPAVWRRRYANGNWNTCDTCSWIELDNTLTEFEFSALAHSGNRVDLFRHTAWENTILRKYFNGTSWAPADLFTGRHVNRWQNMGGFSHSTPYAVSWGTNRIDVFVRGSDKNVYINNTNDAGATWSGWGFLGKGDTRTSVDTSAVSAVAWGSNRLDIFTRENTTVYYKVWTGTGWWPSQTGWENLGYMPINPVRHPPLPVSWGPSRIDLFYYEPAPGGVPNSKTLYHKWTNGNGWGPSNTEWEVLGP